MDSRMYLQSIANIDQYKIDCYYFHGCLALIAREFSVNKLQTIFKVTMLNFIYKRSDTKQRKCSKQFKHAYN